MCTRRTEPPSQNFPHHRCVASLSSPVLTVRDGDWNVARDTITLQEKRNDQHLKNLSTPLPSQQHIYSLCHLQLRIPGDVGARDSRPRQVNQPGEYRRHHQRTPVAPPRHAAGWARWRRRRRRWRRCCRPGGPRDQSHGDSDTDGDGAGGVIGGWPAAEHPRGAVVPSCCGGPEP